MEKHQFDVVIVGGGPAGNSTALSLLKSDPDLKVALLDKGSFEKKRAGEILKPVGQSLLQQMGAWEAFRGKSYATAGQTDDTWGNNKPLEEDDMTPHSSERGWKIDRRAFDAFLFNLAGQKGINTFLGYTLVDQNKTSDKIWLLDVQGPNPEKITFETPFVVDATGQSPVIAPKQGAKKIRFDRLVGVSIIFKNQESISPDTRLLTEPCSQGWWYSVLLPNDQTLAAFMTDNDIAGDLNLIQSKNWWELIKQSNETYNRIKSGTPVSDPGMRIADSYCLNPMQGEGWASVGDATGRLDPLSAHGNCWAMQSGIHVAQPIVNWLRGDQGALTKYQQLMEEEYKNYLIEKRAFYSMEPRWPTSPFWQRRQDENFMDPFQKEIITQSKQNSTQSRKFYFFSIPQ